MGVIEGERVEVQHTVTVEVDNAEKDTLEDALMLELPLSPSVILPQEDGDWLTREVSEAVANEQELGLVVDDGDTVTDKDRVVFKEVVRVTLNVTDSDGVREVVEEMNEVKLGEGVVLRE